MTEKEIKILEARRCISTGPLEVGYYRNIKTGDIYVVTRFGVDSETLEPKVYYTDSQGWHWDRPYELFLVKFERMEHYDSSRV